MLGNPKLQTIIWTACVPAAAGSYGDVMRLPLRGRSHGALVYDVGGSDLRVSPVPATQPSAHTVAGFAVTDLRAAMTDLTDRGVKWERIPGLAHDANGVFVTPEGTQVAWSRDPDGNLLSLVRFAVALTT
jgi:hypothetical protein